MSTQTAVAVQDEQTPAALVAGLEQMRPQFAVSLPSHISAERFERAALTAINLNPALLNADRRTLFNALAKCAQDGLMPDGREAALVIFNTKVKRGTPPKEEWIAAVQYMPMVAGIVKKVRQSGEVTEFRSRCVYAKDTFKFTQGDNERIDHEPYEGDGDRGPIVKVYAIAKGKDDSWIEREVMTRAEVEEVRAVSRAKDNGPWVTWWSEMARKTVMRRLSKRLPVSTELAQIFNRDDELRGDLPPRPSRLQQLASGPDPSERTEGPAPYEAVDAEGVVSEFPTPREAADFVLAELKRRGDALEAIAEHNEELLARLDEEKHADQAQAIRHWIARARKQKPASKGAADPLAVIEIPTAKKGGAKDWVAYTDLCLAAVRQLKTREDATAWKEKQGANLTNLGLSMPAGLQEVNEAIAAVGAGA